MMKALIQYQIEVAICMAALTLLYLLLWRKDTNFIFKRILLLGIPLSSIVIPMINLNIDLQPAQQAAPIQYISYLPAQLELVYMPIAAEAEKLTGWELAFWFLIAGALVMLIRLAGSYYRILQLYRRSSLAPGGNYRIIEEPVQSFSFFNMVMINRTQAQSSELEYILSHEEAHSRQGHSHDVLWLELIKVLHWFNPVIWLITRESKQNMEYLADQEVALKTGSLKSYQYAIVQHAARRGCQLLKTQFSKSNLKRRIAMMNQTNKHTIRSWKLLPAFPVLAVLFMSFSLKIEHLDFTKKVGKVLPFEKMDEPIAQLDTMPNEVFSIVEEMPAPVVGDMDSYYASIYSDLRYPAEARSLGIEGKVFVKFLVQKDGSLTDIEAVQGIGYGCDEEAVRLITEGSKWHPGKQRGQAVDVRMIIPIAFAKEKSKISGVVYTDDGAPVPGATVIIEGTSIGTVTDLDGKFLLTVDSDRTEIVVASVGFKPQTLAIIDGKDYKIYLESDSNAAPPTVVVDNTIDPKKRPLYIVDGIEMEDIGDNALNPQDIRSISVLKDASAIKIYGEKAKNGVVIITSRHATKTGSHSLKGQQFKEQSHSTNPSENSEISETSNQKLSMSMGQASEGTAEKVMDRGLSSNKDETPLIIVDGKEVPYDKMKEIDPKSIESIEVIKDKSSEDKYGEIGKYGVIEIKLRGSYTSQSAISLPVYQEGDDAFYQFIQRRLKYPQEARQSNIQGKVFVAFTVTKAGEIQQIEAGDSTHTMMKEIVVTGYANASNGSVDNVKDLSSLEIEVERVVRKLGLFTPGTKNGKPVDVRMTLPVSFKIN